MSTLTSEKTLHMHITTLSCLNKPWTLSSHFSTSSQKILNQVWASPYISPLQHASCRPGHCAVNIAQSIALFLIYVMHKPLHIHITSLGIALPSSFFLHLTIATCSLQVWASPYIWLTSINASKRHSNNLVHSQHFHSTCIYISAPLAQPTSDLA